MHGMVSSLGFRVVAVSFELSGRKSMALHISDCRFGSLPKVNSASTIPKELDVFYAVKGFQFSQFIGPIHCALAIKMARPAPLGGGAGAAGGGGGICLTYTAFELYAGVGGSRFRCGSHCPC